MQTAAFSRSRLEILKSSPTQLLPAAGAQPCHPGPGAGGPSSHARRSGRCQSRAGPRGPYVAARERKVQALLAVWPRSQPERHFCSLTPACAHSGRALRRSSLRRSSCEDPAAGAPRPRALGLSCSLLSAGLLPRFLPPTKQKRASRRERALALEPPPGAGPAEGGGVCATWKGWVCPQDPRGAAACGPVLASGRPPAGRLYCADSGLSAEAPWGLRLFPGGTERARREVCPAPPPTAPLPSPPLRLSTKLAPGDLGGPAAGNWRLHSLALSSCSFTERQPVAPSPQAGEVLGAELLSASHVLLSISSGLHSIYCFSYTQG